MSNPATPNRASQAPDGARTAARLIAQLSARIQARQHVKQFRYGYIYIYTSELLLLPATIAQHFQLHRHVSCTLVTSQV